VLTKLKIRNFKRFEDVEIELGQNVVFIGPNNSGKTTALQALALWQLGLQSWISRRGNRQPAKRAGVTISRADLMAIPSPDANLLWNHLDTRRVSRNQGKLVTENVRIEIIVEGVTGGAEWACGLEFDYANPESFYCRPLRLDEDAGARMPIPDGARDVRVALLPPMSGLISREDRFLPGSILSRIGEGRTAEVLRNLCLLVCEKHPENWERMKKAIGSMFGATLLDPVFDEKDGSVQLKYREDRSMRRNGKEFDISSSGRGMLQVLLLLSFLYTNPGSTLLLDEPDAHLEILRQRQIYDLVTTTALEQQSQIVAASHSEVLLNEAADKDVVVSFAGRPRRIDDRSGTKSQVAKALKEIGYEHYYQAEQKKWVLYLEGPTDLEILRQFARRLNHPAADALESVFFHPVQQRSKAEAHFQGLRAAVEDLLGLAIFDYQPDANATLGSLTTVYWKRREIENYLCYPEMLRSYCMAEPVLNNPLSLQVMNVLIEESDLPRALRSYDDSWWVSMKATDDFLDPLFEDFFKRLKLPNLMRKSDYHSLVKYLPDELIADEIRQKLDVVAQIAEQAARSHYGNG
jgi:energy-coupling factor transporter ATP-binding protein EcfA2